MIDLEAWVSVPGYAPYQASTHGRVRRGDNGKPYQPYKHVNWRDKSYLRVNLSWGRGHQVKKFVHFLVCVAFHGEAPIFDEETGKAQVCHLDDNSLNNRPENLRWGTKIDNEHQKKKYQEAHAVPLLERGDA